MSNPSDYVLLDRDTDLIPLPHDVTPRSVKERQLLRVRSFRFAAASTSLGAKGDPAVNCPVTLTLVGEPVAPTACEAAVLLFISDGDPLRPAKYDPETRRLMVEFPLTRLASIERTLRHVDEVYLRFQEDTDGRVWADLYTKLEEVGQG